MSVSTDRASLAGVFGVNTLDLNTRHTCLVLNEFGQTVETPAMQGRIVFTACSCRASDAGELLQLDGGYTLANGFIDDRAADLMILVFHPALLLVLQLSDSVELLGFAQLPALCFVPTADELILPAISVEPGLSVIGDGDRRAKDTKVNAHCLPVNGRLGANLLIGDLCNVPTVLLCDTQGTELVILQDGENFFWDDGLHMDLSASAVNPHGEGNTVRFNAIILIIPCSSRFPQRRKFPAPFEGLLPDASGISDTLVLQCCWKWRNHARGGYLGQTTNSDTVVYYVIY